MSDFQYCPRCGIEHPNCQCYADGGEVAGSALDVSKAKVLDQDENMYKIAHPELGEFQIAKSQLSDETKSEIEKLSNKKESAPKEEQKVLDTLPAVVEGVAAQKAVPVSSEINQALNGPNVVPQQPIPGLAPTAAEEVGVQGVPQPSSIDQSFEMQREAAKKESAAQESLAQKQTKVLDNLTSEINKVNQQYQQIYDDRARRSAELENEYRTQKIDPNRAWSSAGTANQILAAVSIVLGGIGQGMTKSGSNVALDIINKAIDRDIDAQKSNLDKSFSLYKLNLEQLQDERAAELATRNNLLSAAKVQMESAAARVGGPVAQANLLKSIAQIDQQQHALRAQEASESILRGGPGGSTQVPTKLLPQQVKVSGKHVGFAATPERAKELQSTLTNLDVLEGDIAKLEQMMEGKRFNILEDINRIPFTKTHIIETEENEKAEALRDSIAYRLRDLFEGTKQTPSNIKSFKNMIGDPTKLELEPEKEKLKSLRQQISDKKAKELEGGLVNYQSVRSAEKPPVKTSK